MSFKTQVITFAIIVAASLVECGTIFFFLFLIDILTLCSALGLYCSACFSGQSYADCARTSSHVACTPSLVVQTHTNLLQYNPTLKAPGPMPNNFYCFQLNFTYPLNGARHFQMGCTNNTHFCDSWSTRRNCTVLGVTLGPHGGKVVTINPAGPAPIGVTQVHPIGGGPAVVVTAPTFTTTTTGSVRKGSRRNGASNVAVGGALIAVALSLHFLTRRSLL